MADKEKYIISIIGEQILDGDSDKVEVLTAGNYIMKNGHSYIGYKEYDENDPNEYYDNLNPKRAYEISVNARKGQTPPMYLSDCRRRSDDRCFYKNTLQHFK